MAEDTKKETLTDRVLRLNGKTAQPKMAEAKAIDPAQFKGLTQKALLAKSGKAATKTDD